MRADPGHGCVSRSTTEPEGNRRRERSRERGADLPARRPGRGGGQRVLRRAGRPQRAVAADPGAAQQARSRRRRRARYRMDPSRIGRVRRGQHRRDQEPVRGAGGPAVTGRAATACTRAAAVVRQVRRADTAARRRQRRAEAMPFLQADSPRQPSWVERRSPHGGRCGAVITALPICSRAGGGREALWDGREYAAAPSISREPAVGRTGPGSGPRHDRRGSPAPSCTRTAPTTSVEATPWPGPGKSPISCTRRLRQGRGRSTDGTCVVAGLLLT